MHEIYKVVQERGFGIQEYQGFLVELWYVAVVQGPDFLESVIERFDIL